MNGDLSITDLVSGAQNVARDASLGSLESFFCKDYEATFLEIVEQPVNAESKLAIMFKKFADKCEIEAQKAFSEYDRQFNTTYAMRGVLGKRLKQEATALAEEARIWRLLWNLHSSEEDVDAELMNTTSTKYDNDKEIVANLRHSNKKLRCLCRIARWCEEGQEAVPSFSITGHQSMTAHRARQSLHGSEELVTDLDPDAARRSGKRFAIEDERDERDILRAVWKLLRRGMHASAREVLASAKRHWRAAISFGALDPAQLSDGDQILQGFKYYVLTKVAAVHEDISTRLLFFHSCRQLAKDHHLSQEERAIYGLQCGDLEAILPMCRTVEDVIWALVKCDIISLIVEEMHQIESERKSLSDFDVGVNWADMRQHRYYLFDEQNINDIKNTIEQNVDSVAQQVLLKELRKSPFAEIKMHIIFEELSKCVFNMGSALSVPQRVYNDLLLASPGSTQEADIGHVHHTRRLCTFIALSRRLMGSNWEALEDRSFLTQEEIRIVYAFCQDLLTLWSLVAQVSEEDIRLPLQVGSRSSLFKLPETAQFTAASGFYAKTGNPRAQSLHSSDLLNNIPAMASFLDKSSGAEVMKALMKSVDNMGGYVSKRVRDVVAKNFQERKKTSEMFIKTAVDVANEGRTRVSEEYDLRRSQGTASASAFRARGSTTGEEPQGWAKSYFGRTSGAFARSTRMDTMSPLSDTLAEDEDVFTNRDPTQRAIDSIQWLLLNATQSTTHLSDKAAVSLVLAFKEANRTLWRFLMEDDIAAATQITVLVQPFVFCEIDDPVLEYAFTIERTYISNAENLLQCLQWFAELQQKWDDLQSVEFTPSAFGQGSLRHSDALQKTKMLQDIEACYDQFIGLASAIVQDEGGFLQAHEILLTKARGQDIQWDARLREYAISSEEDVKRRRELRFKYIPRVIEEALEIMLRQKCYTDIEMFVQNLGRIELPLDVFWDAHSNIESALIAHLHQTIARSLMAVAEYRHRH